VAALRFDPAKTLAADYGIPFGGPTINLLKVVKALHNFLAANPRKLSTDDDLLGSGAPSPALERYGEERATIAKLDRMERERQLVRRDNVRIGLTRIANILRPAGDVLTQHYGPGAAEIVTDPLCDAERVPDAGHASHGRDCSRTSW
jgi:hypothetical protein